MSAALIGATMMMTTMTTEKSGSVIAVTTKLVRFTADCGKVSFGCGRC